MSLPKPPTLSDTDLLRLETLLDGLPPPLQPMDVSALDGYLCGVLLQPRPPAADQWLARVSDMDGRPAPAGPALDELQALVRRRHAELDQAIAQRQWFDPWIYQMEDADGPSECVLPWVAGFAAAMDAFPDLMAMSDTELVEPLALLFMHFDPEDLEDADALLEVIETLEPPSDLAEAVQDVVRALMLMADVTRPRATPPRPARTPRPARRPGGAGGGRRLR
ncbi:MAG: YecA family protein [Betaproteobacteria bacterium]|nr:YecA family protein [Betaproteobacteria bacterium]